MSEHAFENLDPEEAERASLFPKVVEAGCQPQAAAAVAGFKDNCIYENWKLKDKPKNIYLYNVRGSCANIRSGLCTRVLNKAGRVASLGGVSSIPGHR